jgi:hypothetical protein
MKITSKKENKYKKHSIIETHIRKSGKKKLFKKLYRKYKKAYIY